MVQKYHMPQDIHTDLKLLDHIIIGKANENASLSYFMAYSM